MLTLQARVARYIIARDVRNRVCASLAFLILSPVEFIGARVATRRTASALLFHWRNYWRN